MGIGATRAWSASVEQVGEPSGGLDADDLGTVRRAQVVESHPGPEKLGDTGLTALADEAEHGLQLVGADLDPPTPHLHEVLLGRRGGLQRSEIPGREALVADRRLPLEVDDRLHAHAAGGNHPGVRSGPLPGRRPGPQGEAAPASPPRREQEADAGVRQWSGPLGDEPEHPGRVQLQLGRLGLVQQRRKLGSDTHRVAEAGQQLLHRLTTIEPGEVVARPRHGRGDDQARVVRSLQQQLDPPRIDGLRWLVDPQAQPRRSHGR